MAGAMRKMAVYLGLVEDEARYDDYDEFDDYEELDEAAPARTSRESTGRGRDVPTTDARGRGAAMADTRGRSVTPLREEPRGVVATLGDRPERTSSRVTADRIAGGPDGPRITTLHPRTCNEARQIGEHFRDGTPVIMNLTEMDASTPSGSSTSRPVSCSGCTERSNASPPRFSCCHRRTWRSPPRQGPHRGGEGSSTRAEPLSAHSGAAARAPSSDLVAVVADRR